MISLTRYVLFYHMVTAYSPEFLTSADSGDESSGGGKHAHGKTQWSRWNSIVSISAEQRLSRGQKDSERLALEVIPCELIITLC